MLCKHKAGHCVSPDCLKHPRYDHEAGASTHEAVSYTLQPVLKKKKRSLSRYRMGEQAQSLEWCERGRHASCIWLGRRVSCNFRQPVANRRPKLCRAENLQMIRVELEMRVHEHNTSTAAPV